LTTRGRILSASARPGLQAHIVEDDRIRRSDGTILVTPLSTGLRIAASARTSWIGTGTTLVGERDGHITTRVGCDRYGTEAAFDANSSTCFHVAGGWLIESPTGKRWGQVLENQTFVRVGEQIGFGLYRAGLVTVAFVFRTTKPGLKQVSLPPIRGRLLDVAATFDDRRVLIETAVERDGRITHSLTLIDDTGQLRARFEGALDAHPFLSGLGHKAVLGDRILCPTDDGLLSLQVDPVRQTFIEAALFADTEPFVSSESRLLIGPGGSVYVVHPQQVQHLTLLTEENEP